MECWCPVIMMLMKSGSITPRPTGAGMISGSPSMTSLSRLVSISPVYARMEGALDRFGETCYHKTQDSLYETENGQNMMVLKAYREGPGGTGSLYYRRFETSGRQRELPSFNLGIHSGAVRKD